MHFLGVHLNKIAVVFLLLGVCVSFMVSCTGGCWLKADPVLTEPTTGCLALFGGLSASQATVCSVPSLGGVNNCTDNLTLPKRSETGEPVVVPPGGNIDWRLPSQSVSPGITITGTAGSRADYAIKATLGNQSITITISVR